MGLLTALVASGITPVIAVGSSTNTGGAETGQTSLGSADFLAAINALDQAYLASPKCAWLMNRKTLNTVSSIISKQGLLLNLVQWVDGEPFIYGIPVKICPSMPNMGASANSVVLGDLNYWATRLIVGADSGVRVYKEANFLVEQGEFGLKTFVRADGNLLYSGSGSQAPFTFIQQHS